MSSSNNNNKKALKTSLSYHTIPIFVVHSKFMINFATEIFKFKNNMSPTIMNRVFSATTHTYNLRNDTKLRTFNVKTVKYGTETISFRGPKIWELVPEAINVSQSLEEFKIKIKQWKPIGCTCKLCKQYIPNLGYLCLQMLYLYCWSKLVHIEFFFFFLIFLYIYISLYIFFYVFCCVYMNYSL